MPRAKAAAQPAEEQVQLDIPALEPMDARLQQVLLTWGRNTKASIDELELFAPGWAFMIREFYTIMGDVITEAIKESQGQ